MQVPRRAAIAIGLALASTTAAPVLAELSPTREEVFKLLFQEGILGPVDPLPSDPLWQEADRLKDAAPRTGAPSQVADYFATGIPPRFRQAWTNEKLANPVIVDFWRDLGLGRPQPGGDEVAWCAVFANWCLERVHIAGTGSALSQSFVNWGTPVWQRDNGIDTLSNARRGDIAVFRNAIYPSRGHVGFFMGLDTKQANHVMILGGNQGSRIGQDSWRIAGGPQPLLAVRTAKGLRDA